MTTPLLVLGPYHLLRRLGAGGMGEVWLAERAGEHGFRRRCCVKTMLPQLARQPGIAESFVREAVLAARIVHDHVVQVFDFGRDGDTLYLAMEYVDGTTLRGLHADARARGELLDVAVVCSLFADAARGLSAVHECADDDGRPLHLVHRDATPDNILVTKEGLARIGDFGIAMATTAERLTATGELRGKLPFLSPEQLEGEPVSDRSDVFTLGVGLAQLLTGQRPFDRGTDLATMNAIVRDPVVRLSALRPEIPDAVCDLVEEMLQKDPQQRPSASQVAARLARVTGATARPRTIIMRAMAGATAPVEVQLADATVPLKPDVATPVSSAPAPAPVVAANTIASAPRAEAVVTERTPRRAQRSGVVIAGVSAVAALVVAGVVVVSTRDAPTIAPTTTVATPVAPTPVAPTPVAPTPVAPTPVAPTPVAPTPVEPTTLAPVKTSTTTTMPKAALQLRAAPTIQWTSMSGASLGRGTLSIRTNDRSVVAIDPATGGRSVVAVVDGVADHGALPRGKIDVRVHPWAEVFVGERSLGTTPLRPVALPVGRYRVRLVHEGDERTVSVEVLADQVAPVRVDFSTGG